jgi:hypothetical protein
VAVAAVGTDLSELEQLWAHYARWFPEMKRTEPSFYGRRIISALDAYVLRGFADVGIKKAMLHRIAAARAIGPSSGTRSPGTRSRVGDGDCATSSFSDSLFASRLNDEELLDAYGAALKAARRSSSAKKKSGPEESTHEVSQCGTCAPGGAVESEVIQEHPGPSLRIGGRCIADLGHQDVTRLDALFSTTWTDPLDRPFVRLFCKYITDGASRLGPDDGPVDVGGEGGSGWEPVAPFVESDLGGRATFPWSSPFGTGPVAKDFSLNTAFNRVVVPEWEVYVSTTDAVPDWWRDLVGLAVQVLRPSLQRWRSWLRELSPAGERAEFDILIKPFGFQTVIVPAEVIYLPWLFPWPIVVNPEQRISTIGFSEQPVSLLDAILDYLDNNPTFLFLETLGQYQARERTGESPSGRRIEGTGSIALIFNADRAGTPALRRLPTSAVNWWYANFSGGPPTLDSSILNPALALRVSDEVMRLVGLIAHELGHVVWTQVFGDSSSQTCSAETGLGTPRERDYCYAPGWLTAASAPNLTPLRFPRDLAHGDGPRFGDTDAEFSEDAYCAPPFEGASRHSALARIQALLGGLTTHRLTERFVSEHRKCCDEALQPEARPWYQGSCVRTGATQSGPAEARRVGKLNRDVPSLPFERR